MPGTVQSFLASVGWTVDEFVDGAESSAQLAAFAQRTGIDLVAVSSLVARARREGVARSENGDVVVVHQGATLLVGAHASPGEPKWEEALHEIGNALTAVAGWARIARREGSATARGDEALSAIESATLVAIERARASAPKGERAASVGAAIAQSVKLVEPLAAERRVVLDAAPTGELRVPVTRSELVSALSNLLKNAVEACSAGDLVSLKVEGLEGGARFVVTGGRGSELPVVGRSTKGPGRGVGLRIVAEIARASGGGLSFERDASGTTCAHFVLGRAATAPNRAAAERNAPMSGTRPAARARKDSTGRHRSERPRAARPEDALPEGALLEGAFAGHDGALRGGPVSGTMPIGGGKAARASVASVLIVDDEPSIRELIRTALTHAGLYAAAVSGPSELDPHDPRTFELALVDLRLGPLDGLEVARGLVRGGWAMRAALMTGAPMGVVPDDIVAVVRKPFDIDELVEAIHGWTAARGAHRKAR